MRKKLIGARAAFLFVFLAIWTFPCYSNVNDPLLVIPAEKHDISPPLIKIHSSKISNITSKANVTGIVESTLIPLGAFTGIGKGLGNYQDKELYSNANGSVGVNQYMQSVNNDIGVFNKRTGQILAGFPKSVNAIWQGFGGQCASEAGKYTTIKYDQLAHRWVVAFTTSSYLCVAISLNEDATGVYARYAYNLNGETKNAKLGLWPNAYFMSFTNTVLVNNTQAMACALDRNKMLVGEANAMQCKMVQYENANNLYVMPADLDGTTLPASNTPGYFLGRFFDGTYQRTLFFKMYVDFQNSSNTQLSNIGNVFSYVASCSTAYTPEGPLAINCDNFNHRVVYRQFANYGSLVGTHTISMSDYYPLEHWFEFRFSNGSTDPENYQNSYYSHDQTWNRYAGSIAMDITGNIVVASNVSTSLVYPSMEFRSRTISDPKNYLLYRQPLITGHGVPSSAKWSTYSSLSVDPTDDCTFWYTNQYLQASGDYNWSTAIVSFRLPNCVRPA